MVLNCFLNSEFALFSSARVVPFFSSGGGWPDELTACFSKGLGVVPLVCSGGGWLAWLIDGFSKGLGVVPLVCSGGGWLAWLIDGYYEGLEVVPSICCIVDCVGCLTYLGDIYGFAFTFASFI